ncbi:putative translation initiation factor [Pseudoloma neurophilia]|uniref:Putative translation initiation factor n=1 Tax=Pseudoloma neurophilia TaxID=146866 RepID=A0A0R0M4K4_9MICR|nr:putative translation initiation factor [Pseudoloma neurophilia]
MSAPELTGLISLSEKGLELGLNSQNNILPANLYKIIDDILVIGTDTAMKIYKIDFNQNFKTTLIWEKEYGRIRQLEIEKNSEEILIGCLLHTKELKLHSLLSKSTEIVQLIATYENVTSIKLSNQLLFVQFGRELVISHILGGELLERLRIQAVNEYFVGKGVFVVWTGQIVTIYKDHLNKQVTQRSMPPPANSVVSQIMTFTFAQVDSLEVKISPKGNFILICSTSTASGSYFGFKELYLFNLLEKNSKKVQLQNINFFEFVKGGYAVSYGVQPAKAGIFFYSGESKKIFKEGPRNRIYFNSEGNYVCFAGFDNMNGMIEIFNISSGKMVGSMRMLGASRIIWSPCNRFFAVAITNALKVENKIVVYDYFGREISRQDFKSLMDCEWIGKIESFKELVAPKEPVFYKEEKAYVPPSFGTLKRGTGKRN